MAEQPSLLHRRSSAVLAFLLMLLMLLSAVLWGAYKGWSGQRAQVATAQSSLDEMLSARREVITNIVTVAARHLPENDQQLSALRADRDRLGSSLDLAEQAAANERLSQGAAALLKTLAQDAGLQADARDLMYVSQMLPQALEQSQSLVQQAAYNAQAADYNQRLGDSFSGRLAGLLGIGPAQQFVAPQQVTP